MDAQEFLELILKEIVDHPEEAKVIKTHDDMGVLLTVEVNKDDLPLVIGREGSTAIALRKIMKTWGGRHKANINVKIYEPDRPSREKPPSF